MIQAKQSMFQIAFRTWGRLNRLHLMPVLPKCRTAQLVITIQPFQHCLDQQRQNDGCVRIHFSKLPAIRGAEEFAPADTL